VDYGTPRRQDLENRIELPHPTFRLKRSRLADAAALREGVVLAFTPWLAPSAAPADAGSP
jgi:hypothetical protein